MYCNQATAKVRHKLRPADLHAISAVEMEQDSVTDFSLGAFVAELRNALRHLYD
jgi:hypothetical protein